MDRLVSVIVPVFNMSKYLDRCVKSILGQTYGKLEVILVDDGSEDDSGEICDRYAAVDDRVKVIHKQNAGLGLARNSGLDIASGDYVTFIDADDYVGNTRIQHMLEMIIKNCADTCITGYTQETADARKISYINKFFGRCFDHSGVMKDIMPRICGADGSGNDQISMTVWQGLFSGKLIREHNVRFESERKMIAEDLVFDFAYYPLADRVCVTDTCDYFYCDNEGSLTNKYRPDIDFAEEILYIAMLEKAKQLGIERDCKPRLQNTLIVSAKYSIKLEVKFAKDNGLSAAAANIRKICESEVLQQALNELDTTGLKKSSKLVNYLMKKKMVGGLVMTMRVKNAFGI